jgi:hypothetical protein
VVAAAVLCKFLAVEKFVKSIPSAVTDMTGNWCNQLPLHAVVHMLHGDLAFDWLTCADRGGN